MLVTEIQNELNKVEQSENVKILYACESGSRAWGFPSTDSDYDIRFIYSQKRDWYLSILPGRDVLDYPVDELVDLGGWDIRKCFELLRKSNSPLIEWLSSPIVYSSNNNAITPLKNMVAQAYMPESACHHYLAMAKRKTDEVKAQTGAKLKTYFYALRATLCAEYIVKHQAPPPMLIGELLADLVNDSTMKKNITDLVEQKRVCTEKDTIEKLPWLDGLLDQTQSRVELSIPKNPEKIGTEYFDQSFRETLQIVWD